MDNLDQSDFSVSDGEEEGPAVSLECGSCKKKFKSHDRGCDVDERTCSTCTKKAHKLLLDAFRVQPAPLTPATDPTALAFDSTTPTNNTSGVEEELEPVVEEEPVIDEEIEAAAKNNKDEESASISTTTKPSDGTPPTPLDDSQVVKEGDKSDSDAGGEEGVSSDEEEGNNSEDDDDDTMTKQGKKKGKIVADYDANVDDLLVDEESVEVSCGKVPRTLARKRFRSDLGTTVRFFVDLEMLDQLPPLYSFFVLAAHVNPSLKRCVRGMRVVKDKYGKKWVVLCVFRSKCAKPRYDVIMLDPAEQDVTKAVTRLCGLTNFFKWYTYVSDESFDNEHAIHMLKEFVEKKADDKGRALAYDGTRGPNKDEMGRPMSDGFEPVNSATVAKSGMTPAANKRASKSTIKFSDEYGTTKRRGSRGAKKATPTKKSKKPSPVKKAIKFEDTYEEEDEYGYDYGYNDTNVVDLLGDDALSSDPPADEQKANNDAAEWKRKYEMLLLASKNAPPRKKDEEAKSEVEPTVSATKKQKVVPRKSVSQPEERRPPRHGGRVSMERLRALQRMAVRMERAHATEMELALHDTYCLSAGYEDDDGDM